MFNEEALISSLGGLYRSYGYSRYNMNRFEEYDFYAKNKSFLVCDNVITFTDLNGKLMALKPDITLSVIKNAHSRGRPDKIYYNETVYRIKKGAREFSEIMQTGIEYVGDIDFYASAEVIMLAIKTLCSCGRRSVLDLSHMAFPSELISSWGIENEDAQLIMKCIGEKNLHGASGLCKNDDQRKALTALIELNGTFEQKIGILRGISVNEKTEAALDELVSIYEILGAFGVTDTLNLDFSVVNNNDYYNGIVFSGFIEGIPHSVLSGGRYDSLVHRMGKNRGAMGFAIYMDNLRRLFDSEESAADTVIITDGSELSAKAAAEKAAALTADGNRVFVQRDGDGTQADGIRALYIREGKCFDK